MGKSNFILARRDSFPSGICLDLFTLSFNFLCKHGGDYMIPVYQDVISTRPPGTDFTLRLHGEIKFHSDKAREFSTWYLFRFVTKTHRSFILQRCLLFVIKWWNSVKTFVSFFLTDWCHIPRKNTIDLSLIYWNKVLWIFSNDCVN